jgi:hypothetical protein
LGLAGDTIANGLDSSSAAHTHLPRLRQKQMVSNDSPTKLRVSGCTNNAE